MGRDSPSLTSSVDLLMGPRTDLPSLYPSSGPHLHGGMPINPQDHHLWPLSTGMQSPLGLSHMLNFNNNSSGIGPPGFLGHHHTPSWPKAVTPLSSALLSVYMLSSAAAASASTSSSTTAPSVTSFAHHPALSAGKPFLSQPHLQPAFLGMDSGPLVKGIDPSRSSLDILRLKAKEHAMERPSSPANASRPGSSS